MMEETGLGVPKFLQLQVEALLESARSVCSEAFVMIFPSSDRDEGRSWKATPEARDRFLTNGFHLGARDVELDAFAADRDESRRPTCDEADDNLQVFQKIPSAELTDPNAVLKALNEDLTRVPTESSPFLAELIQSPHLILSLYTFALRRQLNLSSPSPKVEDIQLASDPESLWDLPTKRSISRCNAATLSAPAALLRTSSKPQCLVTEIDSPPCQLLPSSAKLLETHTVSHFQMPSLSSTMPELSSPITRLSSAMPSISSAMSCLPTAIPNLSSAITTTPFPVASFSSPLPIPSPASTSNSLSDPSFHFHSQPPSSFSFTTNSASVFKTSSPKMPVQSFHSPVRPQINSISAPSDSFEMPLHYFSSQSTISPQGSLSTPSASILNDSSMGNLFPTYPFASHIRCTATQDVNNTAAPTALYSSNVQCAPSSQSTLPPDINIIPISSAFTPSSRTSSVIRTQPASTVGIGGILSHEHLNSPEDDVNSILSAASDDSGRVGNPDHTYPEIRRKAPLILSVDRLSNSQSFPLEVSSQVSVSCWNSLNIVTPVSPAIASPIVASKIRKNALPHKNSKNATPPTPPPTPLDDAENSKQPPLKKRRSRQSALGIGEVRQIPGKPSEAESKNKRQRKKEPNELSIVVAEPEVMSDGSTVESPATLAPPVTTSRVALAERAKAKYSALQSIFEELYSKFQFVPEPDFKRPFLYPSRGNSLGVVYPKAFFLGVRYNFQSFNQNTNVVTLKCMNLKNIKTKSKSKCGAKLEVHLDTLDFSFTGTHEECFSMINLDRSKDEAIKEITSRLNLRD